MQQSDTIEDYEIWLAECKVERIAELRLLLERHGFTCDYHPSTDRFTISSSTESIMRQVDETTVEQFVLGLLEPVPIQATGRCVRKPKRK